MCVPGGQVPLRTLRKRASDLQRQVGGSSCFRLWEHFGNNPPTKGQTKVFPRGDRTAGIMASVEQRPRGDGGITARVIWRQVGQWTAEKFAVGRNPLLAAKRFKTVVEQAGNRWPEGWVPGQGFVAVETPRDSGHEPTPPPGLRPPLHRASLTRDGSLPSRLPRREASPSDSHGETYGTPTSAGSLPSACPSRTSSSALEHESITTTIDTNGHLLPQGNDLIDAALDAGLGGEKITIST